MSKVTIAIPTYNRPEYLPVVIKSILNQTFQDFNIVIFDSGSNYDINKLVSSFNNPKIKLLTSDQIISSFTNFKRIFTYKYDTDYLVVFHDDDVMHPQMIERELTVMENNKEIVWVGASLKFVHDESKMTDFKLLGKLQDVKLYNLQDLVRLIIGNFNLAFNTVMYRTTMIEYTDKLNEKYNKWADRPTLVCLSKKGKVAVTKEELVSYRVHRGQDSQIKSKNDLPYLLNLCNYYRDNLPIPLTSADKRLFYSWSTNNLIKTLAGFSDSFKEYKDLVMEFHDKGLIRFSYINYRGIVYLLQTLKKYLFAK